MIILILVIAVALFVINYVNKPMFGKRPSGKRLELIKKSPNFKEGKFQNIHFTPDLTEGASFYTVIKEFLFDKSKRAKPAETLPSKKTNLLTLTPEKNILVWFGHSSYFMQIEGKKILVDPVLSGSASPIKATTRSFKGSDVYSVNEIPDIDFLFLSHDHWDHLDYDTIKKLKPRVKKVICGLGVGQHLQRWGFQSAQVIEKDWGDEVLLEEGFLVNITSARHFSGRGLTRNTALWVSFVLRTPGMKIYIGGDSGYETHFADIGDQFGPFDLAILECGQYNKNWKYIHMMPEEVIHAAQDLRAKRLMPVHWGKFLLALHAWDDPIKQISALSKIHNQAIITPMIGEAVDLRNPGNFAAWWETIN